MKNTQNGKSNLSLIEIDKQIVLSYFFPVAWFNILNQYFVDLPCYITTHMGSTTFYQYKSGCLVLWWLLYN